MATFTITTPVNIDSLASKTGADVYNINGGYLTIDQDTRYGTNQNTSAALGNITLSATLGGTLEINSTKVRLIPYNTGTGNVPAYDTVISQGSAQGILLGVYSALNAAPTAVAASMPASGFIKIRQWNEVAFTSGALTGIGASATGADRVGWLEIVGQETGLCTVNRLNSCIIQGDYFDLGTTDGTRATTYQIPSNGLLQYHAGVEVETDTASGIYEFYSNAVNSITATASAISTDAVRGKVCWISTAGLVRFGHDGTNSTGGYIPPTGRKIRIQNIFLVNCTSAAKTANVLPNATLATRYEFSTAGGGAIEIDKASISWYMNLNQPYSLDLSNIAVTSAIVATEIASEINWDNVNVGPETNSSQTPLTLNLCFSSGTISNSTFVRSAAASSGNYIFSATDINGFTFSNCHFKTLVKNGNASTGSSVITRGVNCNFNNTILGGGRIALVTCSNFKINDSVYYDRPAGNTKSGTPMYAYDLSSNCTNVVMSGLTFGGLNLVQPYSGILQLAAAGCSNIKLRNIGTYENPLSLGSPRVNDVSWSRVTTTATVTSPSHGFEVGDIIYAVVSSDTGAIAVGSKTIATVADANTFTFAATNGGATSGTLCYFGTMCANVFVLGTSAAANDISIKRIYAPHTRTNLYTTDNSSKNILIENVFGDYVNAPLIAMLNGRFRNVSGTPPLTAQSSVYGTHWFNGYILDVAENTTSLSWSRSSTTITVTAANHNLRTGMLVNVSNSSDVAAIRNGVYSVTAISSTQFRITGINAGSASGTLDIRVANGRIGLLMNEATEDTVDRYSIDSGAPAFTSAGGLIMPTIGDQITFEVQEYILGQGQSFPIFETVMAGGTLTNYDITYAIDKNDGDGYSTFKNLSHRMAATGGSNGSTTITMTSTANVAVNDYIFGTNVGGNAQVVSIDSGTAITASIANVGTVSGILRFNQLPNENNLGPANGIKLKWRIITAVANATAITSLYVQAESGVTSRSYQYTLDPVTVKVTVLDALTLSPIVGSRILVEANSGGELPAADSVTITRASTTATVTHNNHGLSTGAQLIIRGAAQDEYNGIKSITVVDEDSYTFSVSGSPTTPATGTITSTAVILTGITDSSGILETTSFSYTSNQSIIGKARKATSGTRYKTGTITGTITETGLETTVLLISDE